MTWREVETIKSNKFMMVSRAQTDLRRFVMMDDTNEDNSGIFLLEGSLYNTQQLLKA